MAQQDHILTYQMIKLNVDPPDQQKLICTAYLSHPASIDQSGEGFAYYWVNINFVQVYS